MHRVRPLAFGEDDIDTDRLAARLGEASVENDRLRERLIAQQHRYQVQVLGLHRELELARAKAAAFRGSVEWLLLLAIESDSASPETVARIRELLGQMDAGEIEP
jgi:hypothetical protein